ncbi:histone H1-delta-like [Mytilus californianus]|uniref:histone H1-delta-like n=1 Tax=Mytilus californianus TaxID=6549 RepID=UPI002247937C|nr:histone H1-delta-like [Mytilus californianus]
MSEDAAADTVVVEPKPEDAKPEKKASNKSFKKKSTPASKKKKSKQAPSDHPHYRDMIRDALTSLKERGGSSRQAILKYIIGNYKISVEEKTANNHLKMALRAGVKNGTLTQSKGQGASGSFRLGEVKTKKSKTSSKKKETVSSPKKKVKKPASPKKAKKPAPAKKTKKSKPAKKAKSPKKKAAKKVKAKGVKASEETPQAEKTD